MAAEQETLVLLKGFCRQEDPHVADSYGPAKQLICNQQVIGSNPIAGSLCGLSGVNASQAGQL